MRIVVTGGGSGGHITPILAVAHEIKKLRPKTEIVYIGQRGDALGDIPAEHPDIDAAYTVRAGKLRRYHGEGLKQLLDVPTLLKNARDVVWVMVGLWQSFWLLRRLKPDVVFIKGGFVGVPVGLSAALRRIPYITHDSDALPGLANRIVAPWARLHTVALPRGVYAAFYPAAKTETVGVPISHQFRLNTPEDIVAVRKLLGLEAYGKVLCMTGGGNGAATLNDALAVCAPELLGRYPDLAIVHIAGRALESALRRRYRDELSAANFKRVIVKGFVSNLHEYSAASDVILTRAGGTSMAEFAAQGKACVVVPSPFLAGGHQLKNAKVLADSKAIKIADDALLKRDPRALLAPLTELFDHPEKAEALGAKLATFAAPDAAKRLAMILLDGAE